MLKEYSIPTSSLASNHRPDFSVVPEELRHLSRVRYYNSSPEQQSLGLVPIPTNDALFSYPGEPLIEECARQLIQRAIRIATNEYNFGDGYLWSGQCYANNQLLGLAAHQLGSKLRKWGVRYSYHEGIHFYTDVPNSSITRQGLVGVIHHSWMELNGEPIELHPTGWPAGRATGYQLSSYGVWKKRNHRKFGCPLGMRDIPVEFRSSRLMLKKDVEEFASSIGWKIRYQCR